MQLQVIGGGRMGEALLGGLIRNGWCEASEIRVVEVDAERRRALAGAMPGVSVAAEAGEAEGTVVAVKPPDVAGAVSSAVAGGSKRVLSIAAGVRIAALEAAAGEGVAVIRAMPNTPSLVGVGAAAIAAGSAAGSEDLDWARSILEAVGSVVEVGEPMLDAVTGLSGSGPAYVFLVAEAMIDAGVLVGLPRDVSVALTTQTLLGAATLLAAGTETPEALRAAVTSPGGTTAAGLRVLEQEGVRAAFLDAVVAATERSRSLGGG